MLIDLDKVVSICDEDNNNIVIFGNIKDAEVKAITIDWIENFLDEHGNLSVEEMLAEWKKERRK